MNLRQVLPVLAAGAAIGVLAFLLRMTQSVDPELHLRRVALIRQIDNLDVQLNRTIMQSRFSSLALSGDARVQITNQLGDALAQIGAGGGEQTLAAGYAADTAAPAPAAEAAPAEPAAPAAAPAAAAPATSLRGLSPELDAALTKFQNTIEDKFTLAFDFEARNTTSNQRLINSLDAVPIHASAAAAAVRGPLKDRVKEILGQLTAEVAAYAVTPTPTNGNTIKTLLEEVVKAGDTQSPAYKEAAEQLRTHCEAVLADKADLTGQLNGFLDRPTSAQLQQVEHAYNAWHEAQVARANQYRIVLAGYAATLLVVLGLLGLRLRRSYRDLDAANASLSRANVTLEDTVEERTKDLTKALKDLRESETQLVQSEKMASLGQMVAGVAHEINTPLGYARSNASIVRTSLADIRDLCSAQTRALTLLTTQASDEEVAQALADAQQRAETVNPAELSGDLDNLLADADHGLSQIAELVGSLKDFSRVDRSRTDLFNVNDCIDAALKIAQNQFKHRVEVVKSYAALPKIECSPSQLNQVFLNLFTNAAQAIGDKGKIFIHTATEKDFVAVRVLDTGCGMSEDVKARIFEPFFTTKPVGKGTGLGLSIVYRIVEDHGGRIEVRSAPGKGSEFALHLPLKQKAAAAPAPEKAAA